MAECWTPLTRIHYIVASGFYVGCCDSGHSEEARCQSLKDRVMASLYPAFSAWGRELKRCSVLGPLQLI